MSAIKKRDCPKCNGTGIIENQDACCFDCRGTGYLVYYDKVNEELQTLDKVNDELQILANEEKEPCELTYFDELIQRQTSLAKQLPAGFYDQVWCSRIYSWSCLAAAAIVQLRSRLQELDQRYKIQLDDSRAACDVLRDEMIDLGSENVTLRGLLLDARAYYIDVEECPVMSARIDAALKE